MRRFRHRALSARTREPRLTELYRRRISSACFASFLLLMMWGSSDDSAIRGFADIAALGACGLVGVVGLCLPVWEWLRQRVRSLATSDVGQLAAHASIAVAFLAALVPVLHLRTEQRDVDGPGTITMVVFCVGVPLFSAWWQWATESLEEAQARVGELRERSPNLPITATAATAPAFASWRWRSDPEGVWAPAVAKERGRGLEICVLAWVAVLLALELAA